MSAMSNTQIEQAERFADQLNRDFGDCEDDRPFGELVAAVQTFAVLHPSYDQRTLRQFLHFVRNEAPTAAWEHITTKSRQLEEAKENDWADPVVLHCGCQVGINRHTGAEATLLCKQHSQIGTKTNEQLEREDPNYGA